eukprot:scaffold59602_cov69-Phaeocystis_antarctica.AAC.2
MLWAELPGAEPASAEQPPAQPPEQPGMPSLAAPADAARIGAAVAGGGELSVSAAAGNFAAVGAAPGAAGSVAGCEACSRSRRLSKTRSPKAVVAAEAVRLRGQLVTGDEGERRQRRGVATGPLRVQQPLALGRVVRPRVHGKADPDQVDGRHWTNTATTERFARKAPAAARCAGNLALCWSLNKFIVGSAQSGRQIYANKDTLPSSTTQHAPVSTCSSVEAGLAPFGQLEQRGVRVVVERRRHERGGLGHLFQPLPRRLCEPRVRLDRWHAALRLRAQSARRLGAQQLRDQQRRVRRQRVRGDRGRHAALVLEHRRLRRLVARAVGGEGRGASEHLDEEHAQGPPVDAEAVRLLAHELGRLVERGAHLRRVALGERRGEPKVGQAQVLRLEVAVRQPRLVQRAQAEHDHRTEARRRRRLQPRLRLPAEQLQQVAAWAELE